MRPRRHNNPKKTGVFVLLAVMTVSCRAPQPPTPSEGSRPMTNGPDLGAIKAELATQHGEASRGRVERGLDQAAALWREEDGDLEAFAREYFIADRQALDDTFARLETNFEQFDGHLLEISRELRRPSDLDIGPILKVDTIFAAYDPGAHLVEDFFRNKLAFVTLLYFPLATLKEKLEHGQTYSRRQWAEVRLAGRFGRRVPAEIQQGIAAAAAQAELYISEYNIWMHHLLDEKGQRIFPKGLRLLTHWNLRDELKADYADPNGLAKQRMILKVMEHIVSQTIPQSVINNPRVDWNPYSNQVTAAPAAEIEENAPAGEARPDPAPEANVRYTRLRNNFLAGKRADAYSPIAPTVIARAFDLGAEMPEERVKALLTEVLASPLVPKVAAEIGRRLGRPLEPQDLWFNGFVARGKIPESELDARTRARYPTAAAFSSDMPRILQDLGFPAERARYLSSRIVVDPARGSGHAMQAGRRGDFPRLRTRIEKDGMNYKGYNIAIHEFGHNVEQVLSLYDIDHTLLAGVPNTAFTEALAFVFQARDLELLGYPRLDAASERMRVLNDFWSTWEIAGVALVDIAVWHWMYDHPDASPQELRDAALQISREMWNRYYAPVLGGKDSLLLGIYSHMINYPLYLFNYPLGHLIAFQIEEHINKAGRLGPEFERMAKFGAVTPDLWMVNATGAPVGAGPLLRATEAALPR
jgi:hypothetical protein